MSMDGTEIDATLNESNITTRRRKASKPSTSSADLSSTLVDLSFTNSSPAEKLRTQKEAPEESTSDDVTPTDATIDALVDAPVEEPEEHVFSEEKNSENKENEQINQRSSRRNRKKGN